MTTREAAKYLGISKHYLVNMRAQLLNHEGPKYTKKTTASGFSCIYYKEDLDAWKMSHNWRRKK